MSVFTKVHNTIFTMGLSTTEQKLRILALHGGMTCAKKFKSGTMRPVSRKLKDLVEFEYIDAPFMTRCPIFENNEIVGYEEGELSKKKRSWWRWNSSDPTDNRYAVHGYEQEGMAYVGLEDSLELLYRLWCKAEADGRPFHGILGFSQGAIGSSIFADWMKSTKRQESAALPKFMILVSGFLKPVPLNYPEYWIRQEDKHIVDILQQNRVLEGEATLLNKDLQDVFDKHNPSGFDPTDADDSKRWEIIHGSMEKRTEAKQYLGTKSTISTIPSLHIFGSRDTIMPNERSKALALRYNEAEIYRHSFKRGHDVPSDEESLSVLENFILRQKLLL